MDIDRVLAELIEERNLIDQAIASLERLSAKAGKPALARMAERTLQQKRDAEGARRPARAD